MPPYNEVLDNIFDELKSLREGMYGVAGDTDRPGLIVKIDRLERTEANRVFWFRTSFVASIGALGTVVADLIFRHLSK